MCFYWLMKFRFAQQLHILVEFWVAWQRTTQTVSGMAANNPDCKVISMLGVMMKSLHKGPSVMISLTPVHKLAASYQLERVKEAAASVENAGGRVIGSITDNHKINQQYCKLFNRSGDFQATATYPLDNNRTCMVSSFWSSASAGVHQKQLDQREMPAD